MPDFVPYLVPIDQFFAAVYAQLLAIRAGYPAQPPLVPASLSNFQIGGEFAAVAQSGPRVVIVPTGEDYDYTMQMPTVQTATNVGRLTRRSSLAVWLNFDAHIWGEPDSTARPVPAPTAPGLPNPTVGFNSTIELRRQFLIAIGAVIGSPTNQGWKPLRSEYPATNEANARLGRYMVLSFRIASTNANEVYIVLPYSQTQGDGGVAGQVTVNYTNPAGNDTPETEAVITVPPPLPYNPP